MSPNSQIPTPPCFLCLRDLCEKSGLAFFPWCTVSLAARRVSRVSSVINPLSVRALTWPLTIGAQRRSRPFGTRHCICPLRVLCASVSSVINPSSARALTSPLTTGHSPLSFSALSFHLSHFHTLTHSFPSGIPILFRINLLRTPDRNGGEGLPRRSAFFASRLFRRDPSPAEAGTPLWRSNVRS